MVCGIGFVVILAAAIFSAPTLASEEPTLQELADAFADNQGGIVLSAALSGIAVTLFFGFIGGFVSLLRSMEDGMGVLSRVALASGVASGLLVIMAQSVFAAAAVVSDVDGLEPSVIRALDTVVFTTMQFSEIPRVLFLATAAVVFLRSASAPRWLGWLAAASAILGAIGIGGISDYEGESVFGLMAFLSIILFAVWVLATSITYLRRSEPAKVDMRATATA